MREEAAAAGNISMISRRSMRRRTREGRSLCRRHRQTATRDRGGGRGDTCGGARRLSLLERERLLSQPAKRLMEALKNPFLIRDGGDFRCHVRVFVFSRGGRPERQGVETRKSTASLERASRPARGVRAFMMGYSSKLVLLLLPLSLPASSSSSQNYLSGGLTCAAEPDTATTFHIVIHLCRPAAAAGRPKQFMVYD